jgi:hypothetical protein
MRHRAFLCAAILSAVSACGGRAADNAVGGASGSGSAGGAGSSGDGGSSGGGQAGSCTGSLDSVSKAARFACPPTLCDGQAWAMASCSLWLSVSAATGRLCPGLSALTLTLTDGETETCIYADKRAPLGNDPSGPMLDGALVGVRVTANNPRFCAGTADAISAGQQLPSDCAEPQLGNICARASGSGQGTPSDDDASAPAACPDAFSSSCAPCCPALKPECADKPDGYPGYSCTPPPTNGSASYCSCSCSAGQWQCGC